jgi:alkaline phosphatase D
MEGRLTSRHFSRRRFVAGAGAAFTAIAPIAAPSLIRTAVAQSWRAGNPFSLGVASGAPRADGFVLWTRLAPDPLSSNPETPGGMTGADVALRYEIASDPGMSKIVRRGAASAEQALAYSVHVDVAGLEPGRSYWYRFLSGDAASPTGHAATLPAPGSAPATLRFGFVSCSNYEHGYFSAYRHLTGENPAFVLFLGDYIYETVEQFRPIVRRHRDGVEAATLPTYRNRYANTGSTRTCKACMRRFERSSPGTITKCKMITPTNGRRRLTIQSNFCRGVPRPTRPFTNTCRCGRSSRGQTAP